VFVIVSVSIYVCIRMGIRVYIYIICMYAYVCLYTYVYVYAHMFVCTCGCLACIYNYLYVLVACYSILDLFGEIRTSNSDNNNKDSRAPSRPPPSSPGEQRVLLIHAKPSSETGTVTFSSALATLPCSPMARNDTTATAAATRPVTSRFPNVSVSSSFYNSIL